MATENCKEFFVPQIVKVVEDIKKKAEGIKDNKMLDAQKQMAEGMANLICKYVFSKCATDKRLDDALALEYKSADRAFKYILQKAKELNVQGSMCLWIPDETVYGWIEEYYFLDDKADFEKEKAAEEEKAKKAAEALQKKAEKDAKKAEKLKKDIEKAQKLLLKDESTLNDKQKEFLKKMKPYISNEDANDVDDDDFIDESDSETLMTADDDENDSLSFDSSDEDSDDESEFDEFGFVQTDGQFAFV